MTDSFEVEREDAPGRGRYVIHLPDGTEAEMTYRHARAGVIAIDHTFVPEPWRTHGLALKLVERAIADARAQGVKIVPICSYVVAQFRRHPDWGDLLAEG